MAKISRFRINIKRPGKKYLFLDIDGVMNSFSDYNMSGEKFLENINDICFIVSEKQINLLNQIVEKYNPEIVLSSYWRTRYPLEEINDIFQKNGFIGTIIAKTDQKGEEHRDRWAQIKRFVDKNNVKNYIILDDDSLGNEAINHIKTDPYKGIEKKHINRIRRIWE
jgi:hypothetical protein